MAKGTILNYPNENYNLQKLRSGILTEAQMRKEYSYLRTIANKRLNRMENSEFSDSEIYLKNRYKFVSLKNITDADELAYRLYEVAKFVESRTSTITGQKIQRKEIINVMHEKGMYFINTENYKQFYDFMTKLRSMYGNRFYDSERAYESFVIAEAKKLDPFEVYNSYDRYRKETEEMERLIRRANKQQISSSKLRSMLINNIGGNKK